MNKNSNITTTYFLVTSLLGLLLFISLVRPFISDEFHEAVMISKLFKLTPYKDFEFYKNLLGYYIKAPFLLLPTSWWNKLILSRLFLFSLFTAQFLFILYYSKKWFARFPFIIAFTLPHFITQSILHTTAYRVDLITMALSAISLFMIFDRKCFKSGILLGLSFCVSQKAGIYFLPLASAIVLTSVDKKKDISSFIGGLLIPIISYIGFWGFISDFKTVLYTVFVKDTIMATSAGLNVRWYWLKSLKENTFIYLFSIAGFTPLFWRDLSIQLKAGLLFTTILFFEALLLGQPWPHWFILWSPFLVFPLFSFLKYCGEKLKRPIILILLLFITLLQPLGNLFYRYQFNNDYQKFNILLLESFLQKGDTYLAGVDVHEGFQQAPEELKEMYAMNRITVFKKSKEEKEALVQKFIENPPKILFYNYRLREMIPEIQIIFEDLYYHFWGNIYAYQVKIQAGTMEYKIPFKGTYFFTSKDKVKIKIGKRILQPRDQVLLKPGKIKVESKGGGFLKLVPSRYNVQLERDFLIPRSLHLTFDSK